MGRAPCCDKANVKKGPWSPEEDAKLKSYITNYGTGGNWIALPQKIGLKRCGKSCRLRWLNYLRPNIKHGGFTEEEENIICSLFISIGSRWSIIAAQLPGRTDNDIKNYWNTRLKKKLMAKQRKEQEIKREIHDGYFVNQTQACQQIPYWAGNLTMPMLNPSQEGLLRSQYNDHQLAILLTKTRGPQTSNNPNHLLSNGVNYQHSIVQDQFNPDSMDSTNNANYSNWQNSTDQYGGVNGDGLTELESYYSMMSFEGTESYSSVEIGNSSTTINSSGSTSLGDMSSSLLVTTPVSDFDAYQRGMLHNKVVH